jgi:predicted molibdopterin-dependent oxidoreductase YjgC
MRVSFASRVGTSMSSSNIRYTASRLKEIKEAHGSDSIAFLASAKVTNEENYIIMKFARAAVGTNNVDHCARL